MIYHILSTSSYLKRYSACPFDSNLDIPFGITKKYKEDLKLE
jgi:hypothetical protein